MARTCASSPTQRLTLGISLVDQNRPNSRSFCATLSPAAFPFRCPFADAMSISSARSPSDEPSCESAKMSNAAAADVRARHVHARTHVRTHTCTHAHLYARTHALTHTCTHASTHTRKCTYAGTSARTQVRVHVRRYECTRLSTRTRARPPAWARAHAGRTDATAAARTCSSRNPPLKSASEPRPMLGTDASCARRLDLSLALCARRLVCE
eukprot:1900267-Pleurochrysis_carterae.AAC.1